MLGEISDKMKAMGEQEQIAMLAKLGIDGSMIQTLRLGNDELKEQIALASALTLGVGNAENAETAAAFKDALTQVSQAFTEARLLVREWQSAAEKWQKTVRPEHMVQYAMPTAIFVAIKSVLPEPFNPH